MAKRRKKTERVQQERENTCVFLYHGESFGKMHDGFIFRGTEKQLKEYFSAEFEEKPQLLRSFNKLI